MSRRHEAAEGDSIPSIAVRYGFFPETVWQHPENADLRELRGDPNILSAGDEVFIPAKRRGMATGSTEKRHRFVKKGVPARLRLQLLDDDEPRSHLRYVMELGGVLHEGETDDDGYLQVVIPPEARSGELRIEGEDPIPLDVSRLDPVDQVSGVQMRLNNLGYDCGEVDGKCGSRTEGAVRKFQEAEGLQMTGQLDQETSERLSERHGC
ncbi:MAG: peptidoglycan-binding domain-containing protein [Planctomycetota bacterium]